VTDPIVGYYTDAYDESARLQVSAEGRLERLRTEALLRRYLPPAPCVVADVGGGTGVYARWLADLGYRVTVVDLTPSHVTQARHVHDAVGAVVGDARQLPIPTASQDATLLLGPLYHLPEPADRARAMTEAVRVTKPGGVVIAAAISRYAALLGLAIADRLDDATLRRVRAQIATGRHDPHVGFTTAYMHGVQELHDEFRAAGLTAVGVVGVEGPLWMAAAVSVPELDLTQFVLAAEELDAHPDVAGVSAHLLAVGSVPVHASAADRAV
jgi:ubiquinone/menaquinone biosynthesis C-methylase UbiE